MKISVAVRQKFHGFHLAEQLGKREILGKLYTSYYGSFFGKSNNKGYSINTANVKTNSLSAFFTYGLSERFSFFADSYFGSWVAKNIGEEDIIITWGLYALPIIQKAKKLGIKVLFERGSSHVNEQKELLFEEYQRFNINTQRLNRSFSAQRIERELIEYELADYISIPSKFVRNTFVKNGVSQKLFLNNYGANLTAFSYDPIGHKTFRIIYVGSLNIRKGIQYLLMAMKLLKGLDVELWVVGKKSEEVDDIIKKYYDSRITYFDPVPQHELKRLYNSCDVFVICSIEEGLAMVQLEAMACGLPVICTTNTGGDDFIEDGLNGFVLPIRDPKQLQEKIEFFFNNRIRCEEMGRNALLTVQCGLSWSDYGRRAVEFYASL